MDGAAEVIARNIPIKEGGEEGCHLAVLLLQEEGQFLQEEGQLQVGCPQYLLEGIITPRTVFPGDGSLRRACP